MLTVTTHTYMHTVTVQTISLTNPTNYSRVAPSGHFPVAVVATLDARVHARTQVLHTCKACVLGPEALLLKVIGARLGERVEVELGVAAHARSRLCVCVCV